MSPRGVRLTLAQLARAVALPEPSWSREVRAVFFELFVLELVELIGVTL